MTTIAEMLHLMGALPEDFNDNQLALNSETAQFELHIKGEFDSIVAELESPLWKALVRYGIISMSDNPDHEMFNYKETE